MRLRRVIRSERGFSLVELIVTMTILLIVITAITDTLTSGARSEANVAQRIQEQSDARQALALMREDVNCAYKVQAVGPRDPSSDSGFYLYLSEQYNTCQAVDSSSTSGGSRVFLAWCTIPVPGSPGVYSLYRDNLLGSTSPTSTCDSSGTLEASDIVAPLAGGWPSNAVSATPSTWNGNIWPDSLITCTPAQTGYLPTVGVDLAVNPALSKSPGGTYELKDQLTLRNGTRCSSQPDTFAVSAPTPASPAAGASFTVNVVAQSPGGGTDTSYSGIKTIVFSGPTTSPLGNAPSYPASVTFINGTGIATMTLYNAASTSLTATEGTTVGSASFTVAAGTPAALTWTGSPSVSKGTLSAGCITSCTWTGGAKKGTFTATVTANDGYGNVVSGIGAGHTVTFSATTNSWSSSSLALPASGLATTSSNSWQAPNNTTWSSTLTASSPGLTSITITGSA